MKEIVRKYIEEKKQQASFIKIKLRRNGITFRPTEEDMNILINYGK